ncbi:hypothetical protein M0811_01396 [Anaeramoeba ignava]|uniref:Uncharacterized protein n=1 Tax=Anaeramoeba ignava TaxID=1746090 RepID=A0A9Q0LGF1_ANAIG|nr:hypothetical protein M0811_01396 [Anaeramoeba ignava]
MDSPSLHRKVSENTIKTESKEIVEDDKNDIEEREIKKTDGKNKKGKVVHEAKSYPNLHTEYTKTEKKK